MDRICIWPNDDFCFEDELEETLTYKSDDYRVVEIDTTGSTDIEQFVYNFNRR